MKRVLRVVLLLSLCWSICGTEVSGQKKRRSKKQQKQVEVVQPKDTAVVRPKGLPTVKAFVKPSAKSFKGMFNVYVQDGRYYVEIPDSLMGRDYVAVMSLVKGSAQLERSAMQMMGFSGDALTHRLFRFEKGERDRVHMVEPDYRTIVQDTTSDYYRGMKKYGKQAVSMIFEAKAKGESSVLVDMTDVLNADNSYFSLKDQRDVLGLGAYQADKSYVSGVSVFGDNVIFRMVKSYATGALMKMMGRPAMKTEMNPTKWEVGVSICLLPKEPMRVREEDKRVGYFVEKCAVLDKDSERWENLSYVSRWRLEPRPEDMEKYKRGELVEPVKPIVFYVDYDMPEYLLPYMIEGVNSWQKSFEKIGFKNAIIGKKMPTPEEDPNFSVEDARYSVISYKASPMQNAYGPHMSDPRTGEILCSHVGLFHNVQQLIQRWYFTQTAMIDPRCHRLPLPDSLMGELAKYIVAHEIGHTLGLRHNFLSSYTYTIDQLRDRDYVKEHGTCASIMDYARFNYVAQPEDNLDPDDLIPQIREYDDFAIDWGYRYFPGMDEREESKYLQDWVTKEQARNPRVRFGSELLPGETRFQSEDLGDDHFTAGVLGMRNLKGIMPRMEEWTAGAEDDAYSVLKTMYQGIRYQYLMYMTHVSRYVGGYTMEDKLRSEGVRAQLPTEKALQQKAMAFLNEHLFTCPEWMFDERLCGIVKVDKVAMMKNYYGTFVKQLMSSFLWITKSEAMYGKDGYTPKNMADDLYKYIFTELSTGKPVSPVRRELQRIMIANYQGCIGYTYADFQDVAPVLLDGLEKIRRNAKQAASASTDYMTRLYWESVHKGLDAWFDGDKAKVLN